MDLSWCTSLEVLSNTKVEHLLPFYILKGNIMTLVTKRKTVVYKDPELTTPFATVPKNFYISIILCSDGVCLLDEPEVISGWVDVDDLESPMLPP